MYRAWREGHPGYMTAWRQANPEKDQEQRARGNAARRERKVNLRGRYADARTPGICRSAACPNPTNVGPWHDGHEPPMKWLSLHPEYDGPCVIRTEHAFCNMSKHDTPDWEMRAAPNT